MRLHYWACDHTEIEAANPTCCFIQAQYSDTKPTRPSTDLTEPSAWLCSQQSTDLLSHWLDWTGQSRGRCYTVAGPVKADDDAILPLDRAKQKTMLYCCWSGQSRRRCYTAAGPGKAGDDPILSLDHTMQRTMLVSVAGPHKAGDDAILPLDHTKQGTMLYCRWTTQSRGRCCTAAGPHKAGDDPSACRWTTQSRGRC